MFIICFLKFKVLCGSFPMLFPKAPASCCKKNFEPVFAALYFYKYEFKKCLSDF